MKFIPNPIPTKLHFLSSLRIVYQRPVSIGINGKRKCDVRNLVIHFLDIKIDSSHFY
jgi:hypothetical protein